MNRQCDGSLIVTPNQCLIIDIRLYMVHFPGCKEDDYSANIIAVNMIAQCNHYGNQYLLLDSIFGHKEDDSAIK